MKKTLFWLLMTTAAIGCGDEGRTTSNPDSEETQAVTQSVAAPAACTIDAPRELLITDNAVTTSVLTRNMGPWSFGGLVSQMTPRGQDPSDFVIAWLESWAATSSVNGFPTSSASVVRSAILCPWAQASGTPCGGPNPIRLDLVKAPFRLIAIVNRVDLRRGSSPGEGRFVFNILDGSGKPLEATVIFEYGLPPITLGLSWAQRWHDLASVSDAATFGQKYRDALLKLTDGFTSRDAARGKPNGSAINQVRTNEIAFVPTWNLREFHLSAATGALLPSTTAETPDFKTFNNAPRDAELSADLIAHRAEVLAGTYHPPAAWLGGEALQQGTWNPKNLGLTDERLRHAFAGNTCDGCHLAETGARFTHLILDNDETNISDWLRDVDLPRRVLDMQGLVCATTRETLEARTPASRVH